jgi:HD-like signal output (HDOD) protein
LPDRKGGDRPMNSCFACGEELLDTVRPFKPRQLVGCKNCLNVSLVQWDGDNSSVSMLQDAPTLGSLAPSGSVMAGVMSVIPEVIPELPVLAEIPQRVVATIHDPISSIQDVVEIVEDDAVMSTKVLSVANSAYFATVTEIGDLSTACSRLGMRALVNIAHAMSTANQYNSPIPEARHLMERLWRHAVATAHCAEAVARVAAIDSNLVYIAGLLHDIGKVVLVDAITTKYSGNVGRLKEAPDVLARAIEPFSPLVGLHVAQHWNLQGELLVTLYYANDPAATIREDCVRLSHCVKLASDIAEAKGFGVAQTSSPVDTKHPSIGALGLSEEQFHGLSAELDEKLDEAVGAFATFI